MDIKAARYTANYGDDFVVFHIGLRVNCLWRVKEWWPVVRAANAMTEEAKRLPNTPLLNSNTVVSLTDWRVLFFVQHWRSFDELMAWANDADLQHRPAQKEFFRRTAFNGHVGVWHETYKVAAGEFEAIYANMPRMGLAAAGTYRELRPSTKGYERMGKTDAH
jgi:hypothetical protein